MIRRLLIAVGLLTVLLIPGLVRAQSSSSGAGQGLEISPPLIDLKADPGQTVQTEVRVRNVTTGPLIVKPQINDFIAAGEDGQPKILLEEGEESPYSMKQWITVTPSLRIEAGEQKKYSININVPGNASPGGHYGVVRFTGTSPEIEDTGVSLAASVGSLLLVNVSGDVMEQARISEMFATQSGKVRSIFEYSPVTIVEKIENTGNIHIKPSGTVRVLNMFNKQVASFQLNEKGGNVLPGSTRKFEQTVSNKFMFGRYKAQADVVYGSDGKIMSRTISFWVIPYKLMLLVIAGVALLVFLVKRYNRYIVNKAGKKPGKKDGKKSKK